VARYLAANASMLPSMIVTSSGPGPVVRSLMSKIFQ
jgi:hypothetical protein